MRMAPALALLAACSSGGPKADTVVPDFNLEDVNATSDRFGTQVSPRDLKGQVSGWYFGHAT